MLGCCCSYEAIAGPSGLATHRLETKALGDRAIHVRLEDQPDNKVNFSLAYKMHRAT